MKIARLCDVSTIISILEDTYGEGTLGAIELYLSSKLRFTIDNTYYLNEDNTILVIFERVGVYKCQVHVYTLKEGRGKKAKEFFTECYKDICKSHGYTSFLTFIPEGDKVSERAATYMGFKKVGIIERANDTSYETLYTLTKSDASASLTQKEGE